jgi:hypothetical protein
VTAAQVCLDGSYVGVEGFAHGRSPSSDEMIIAMNTAAGVLFAVSMEDYYTKMICISI